MSQAAFIPYSEVTEGLRDSSLQATPAEAHGLLCGLYSSGSAEPEKLWWREIFGSGATETQPGEYPAALRTLADLTRLQMEENQWELSLLVPGEEYPLRERAEGLHDWARGFLFGLGLAGIQASALSTEGREVLSDLIEITRLDVDSLRAGEAEEEDEEALMQLQEYLWIATHLLREEAPPHRD